MNVFFSFLPTVLEIAGVSPPHNMPLDGQSLLSLIEDGDSFAREIPMGFWDATASGIRTPSAEWMPALLAAQKDGGDLPPHESSQRAAELPHPSYPTNSFPGHAAWIDGDWKLHRIELEESGEVTWELYDLAADPAEADDLAHTKPGTVARMKPELEAWLVSVVRSLNGEDYSAGR